MKSCGDIVICPFKGPGQEWGGGGGGGGGGQNVNHCAKILIVAGRVRYWQKLSILKKKKKKNPNR